MMDDRAKHALATALSLGFIAKISSEEQRRYLADLVRKDIAETKTDDRSCRS